MDLLDRLILELEEEENQGTEGQQATGFVRPRFSLLTSVSALPRTERIHILTGVSSPRDFEWLATSPATRSSPMALDLETKGTSPLISTDRIVGIGFADERGSIYIDLESAYPGALQDICELLARHDIPLIAHNLFFDGSWILHRTGLWLNWVYCTYALYKHLATEGWDGQKWGLKDAQKELLGWHETNEGELDEWLVRNGYKKNSKKGVVGDKAEMWRAPAEVLGHYCALDCDATYLLFTLVLRPAMDKYQGLSDWMQGYSKNYQQTLSTQYLCGIRILRPELLAYHSQLTITIEEKRAAFLSHKDIAKNVETYNENVRSIQRDKEPARFLAKKLGNEPPKHTKKGDISANWIKWQEKAQAPLVVSKNWLNWEENTRISDAAMHFNMNSGLQMQWLLYNRLGQEVLVLTDSGQPSTSAKALIGMGEEWATLLLDYKDKVKEESYVAKCIDSLIQHDDGEWYLHPQFRVPGTLTCRLSGSGGVNVQQLPKSEGYLSCWVPRPGKIWVDCDHTALEQVVLAELSKDPSLWKLYGPNAKPNDVYLFSGAGIKGLGDKIRAHGYDPENPVQEIIDLTKKLCKPERDLSKNIVLGSSYGMGAGKLQMTLKLQKVSVSLYEAKEMLEGYWELYKGVKIWEKELLRQYRNNNGWVLNGIGRPIGVFEPKIKDIVNRVVQSTGHDIHVLYTYCVQDLLSQEGIPWAPIISDFHDQMIIEVDEEHAEQVKLLMSGAAYERLNSLLGGEIPMKGHAAIVKNLAEAKCG